MGALPDRGYTLARAAGLMLTAFVFWFLGSVGLLRNDPAGMVFAWLVIVTVGAVAVWRWDERPALRPWLGEHWPLVVVTEVLFLALLFGWAIYRAHNPEMASTEKPMEIMFINAIRASETFPPQDAWLSGYAISYYYFGYVMIAMLADLSSVSSSISFNITIALVFALTGIGALGLVYNLVRADAVRRGVGVADMAAALRDGRPHRAAGEMAYHVLDVMHSFYDSSAEGRTVSVESTCVQPAALPVGAPEGFQG